MINYIYLKLWDNFYDIEDNILKLYKILLNK